MKIKYSIDRTEFYHAGGNQFVTICQIDMAFLPEDFCSVDELLQLNQASTKHEDMFVVVGCGYLNVYDVEPFSSLESSDFGEPGDSWELSEVSKENIVETYPDWDLTRFTDDFVFNIHGIPAFHPFCPIFNACCLIDKIYRVRTGYVTV